MKSKTKASRISGVDQSSSSQIVASIDDLLTQILLRLPIRSLIRFKSISKHWNSLITDPQFCFQRNPNPNPAVGLLVDGFDKYIPLSGIKSTKNPPFTKSKFIVDSEKPIVLQQSCNGLLLCCSFGKWDHDNTYFIYNLTTNRFLQLPKTHGLCRRFGMSLAFDPAKSPYYEVVCVGELDKNYFTMEIKYQVEVYSSESRVWRKCGEPFIKKDEVFQEGVYCNGAIHWYSRPFSYYNIEDEILREMKMPPLPPDALNFQCSCRFWESCDHLHFTIMILRETLSVDVYEMRRDYSEWFVKYQVDLSPVVDAYPNMTRGDGIRSQVYMYELITVVRGARDEDAFLVLHLRGKIVRYNIVYQTFEMIYDFEIAEEKGVWRSLGSEFHFIESLCCV